jgi:bifunctional DNase/RNase
VIDPAPPTHPGQPPPPGLTPLVAITLACEAGTDRGALVLRTADQAREMVLVIPRAEAVRLAPVFGLTPCPCAPLYVLVEELIGRLGARLDRAVLDGRPEGITASLVLADGLHGEMLGCHPADAVALALRYYVPILATEAALAHAHPIDAAPSEEPLRAWLARVRPEDFRAPASDATAPRPEPEP